LLPRVTGLIERGGGGGIDFHHPAARLGEVINEGACPIEGASFQTSVIIGYQLLAMKSVCTRNDALEPARAP
jgi:hypothetical protein